MTDEFSENAGSIALVGGTITSGKGKKSLCWGTVVFSCPSALATADTTTAGAGAAVPGSFQKLDVTIPEEERA